jgi:hypothetical protein
LRRTAVLGGLLVGAVVGGVLLVEARRFTPILPLAVTAAVLVTAVCLLHRHEAVEETAV